MRTKVTAMSGTKGHLRTLVALAASLMALLVAALAPTAGADETSASDAGVPVIGYWTDTNAVVADAEGRSSGRSRTSSGSPSTAPCSPAS
jgi:hypothetical protein